MEHQSHDESANGLIEDICPDHHDVLETAGHPGGDGLVKPGCDDRLANTATTSATSTCQAAIPRLNDAPAVT